MSLCGHLCWVPCSHSVKWQFFTFHLQGTRLLFFLPASFWLHRMNGSKAKWPSMKGLWMAPRLMYNLKSKNESFHDHYQPCTNLRQQIHVHNVFIRQSYLFCPSILITLLQPCVLSLMCTLMSGCNCPKCQIFPLLFSPDACCFRCFICMHCCAVIFVFLCFYAGTHRRQVSIEWAAQLKSNKYMNKSLLNILSFKTKL